MTGVEDPEPPPSVEPAPIGTVTRSRAGCSLETVAEPIPAGAGRLTVVNETNQRVAFALYLLHSRSSFARSSRGSLRRPSAWVSPPRRETRMNPSAWFKGGRTERLGDDYSRLHDRRRLRGRVSRSSPSCWLRCSRFRPVRCRRPDRGWNGTSRDLTGGDRTSICPCFSSAGRGAKLAVQRPFEMAVGTHGRGRQDQSAVRDLIFPGPQLADRASPWASRALPFSITVMGACSSRTPGRDPT
jgi:hypothetical protein